MVDVIEKLQAAAKEAAAKAAAAEAGSLSAEDAEEAAQDEVLEAEVSRPDAQLAVSSSNVCRSSAASQTASCTVLRAGAACWHRSPVLSAAPRCRGLPRWHLHGSQNEQCQTQLILAAPHRLRRLSRMRWLPMSLRQTSRHQLQRRGPHLSHASPLRRKRLVRLFGAQLSWHALLAIAACRQPQQHDSFLFTNSALPS